MVDAVGGRAGTFNQQAADSSSKLILTNIIRAAYAEPLQFTSLSAATGQGSIGGTAGANVPFPFRGGAGQIPLQIIGGTLNSTSSVGNSFTVSNQNNQEFYQGIQRPMSEQLLFSLMSEGYDPRIILNLFVSEIILTGKHKTVILRNNPEVPNQWNNFYSAINSLIRSGFDAERISDVSQIGPELSTYALQDPRLIAALIGAPDSAPAINKVDGKYRLQKREYSYRACFRDAGRSVVLAYYGYPVPDPAQTLTLNDGDNCGAPPAERAMPNSGVKLHFRTRSVKAAILYLGAMVRVQWGIAATSENNLQIPHSDGTKFSLFKVSRDSQAEWVSVSYRGQYYGLKRDPAGLTDGSSRVMQLLTDSLALQSSSKDVPAPTIISVL